MKTNLYTVFFSALFLILIILFAGRFEIAGAQDGCDISGPKKLIPETYQKVKLGLTLNELEKVLGEHTYSPIEGQYYFVTEGKCPLEGTDMMVSCGYIVDFRRAPSYEVTDKLQECTWGAIGE